MTASELHLEYSTNSKACWSMPAMAGMSDEQLERTLFPDGCQPGRCASRGADGTHNADVDEMLAALDALDNSAPPSTAVATTEPPQHESPREPEAKPVQPIPAALARFWALKAEDARRKEERREAAKLAKTREQSRIRKQRQRAKDRTAVAIDAHSAAEDLLTDLGTFREFSATGWAHQYDQRLATLRDATANPSGDAFLIQMKGREIELVQGWVAQQRARESFGPKASLSRVAAQAGITKSSAQKLVKNIAKLEERGRPWHRM